MCYMTPQCAARSPAPRSVALPPTRVQSGEFWASLHRHKRERQARASCARACVNMTPYYQKAPHPTRKRSLLPDMSFPAWWRHDLGGREGEGRSEARPFWPNAPERCVKRRSCGRPRGRCAHCVCNDWMNKVRSTCPQVCCATIGGAVCLRCARRVSVLVCDPPCPTRLGKAASSRRIAEARLWARRLRLQLLTAAVVRRCSGRHWT
jgi:hypothetical protein